MKKYEISIFTKKLQKQKKNNFMPKRNDHIIDAMAWYSRGGCTSRFPGEMTGAGLSPDLTGFHNPTSIVLLTLMTDRFFKKKYSKYSDVLTVTDLFCEL